MFRSHFCSRHNRVSDSVLAPRMSNHLIKEITDTANFLKSRGNLGNTSDAAVNLRNSLAKAMASQITNMHVLHASDAGALQHSLDDKPYGEFTELVATAIDNRLSFTADAATRKCGKVTNQVMTTSFTYFSRKDVALFRNPKVNMHTKLSVLVARLNRLGISNPHEKTIRWCLAFLIMLHYNDIPSPREIFNQVKDCKDVIDAERKPYPHHLIVNYPKSPADLPENMRKYAYDADDPWEDVHVQGLEDMATNKMIMRSNHKALKASTGGSANRTSCKTEENEPSEPARAHGGVSWAGLSEYLDKREATRSHIAESRGSRHDHQPAPWVKREARDDHEPAAGGGAPLAVATRVIGPGNDGCRGGVSWGCGPARGRFDLDRHDQEMKEEREATVKREAGSGGSATGDLSEYGRLAIESLSERDAKKRQEATRKKKEAAKAAAKKTSAKRESDDDDDDDDSASADASGDSSSPIGKKAMKAVKAEPKKRGRPPKVVKKPAAATGKLATAKGKSAKKAKPEPVTVSKTDPMPKPPVGTEAPPSDYKGGRIYWKISSMAFRVIRKRQNYASEKRIKWATAKPTKGEWKSALRAIDDYKGK